MGKRLEKYKRGESRKEIYYHESREAKRKIEESTKYQKNKKDSEERQQIRNIIIKNAKDGMKKIDILILLNNKFSDSANSKYFAIWIDYFFKKLKIIDNDRDDR